MNFNSHTEIKDKHAILSPSVYHWTNYQDDQKLEARFVAYRAAKRGTDLHDLAHTAIKLGVNLSTSSKTLAMYVRDGIDYNMEVEQPLYYSPNCFGSADTISFRRKTLRIHDLKTGMTKSSMRQLEVYAAIFCLEYGINPYDINMNLRIYQNKSVNVLDGDPDVITYIMERIIDYDMKLDILKEGGVLS